VALSPGDKPGPLLTQDFYKIKLDSDSLFKVIQSDFEQMKAAAARSQTNVKPQ
jgi:hypothetical protein